MTDVNDWNQKTIAEFRANGGKVGGYFEGAPLVLLHHRGRKSGTEYPPGVMYMADDGNEATIYVFASKEGAVQPGLVLQPHRAGDATVERGTETYPVTVSEVTGDRRDRIYAEQGRRYPACFADYAEKTEGIRKIPVLELTRS